MAVSEDFAGHVQELLSGLGAIRIKRMFGGAGVYVHDMVFGLLIDETLYLKADDITESEFRAAASEPFIFEAKGKSIPMRYWRLPDDAADDRDAAERWARLALDAALRAKKPKKGAARADIGPGPWDG